MGDTLEKQWVGKVLEFEHSNGLWRLKQKLLSLEAEAEPIVLNYMAFKHTFIK